MMKLFTFPVPPSPTRTSLKVGVSVAIVNAGIIVCGKQRMETKVGR